MNNAGQGADSLHGRRSRKRPHHEIEDSESEGEAEAAWRHGGPSTSAQSLNTSSGAPLNLPHLQQMRLPGYDYRRPIMSTGSPATRTSPLPSETPRPAGLSQHNVIDLTQESEQPSTRTPGHNVRPPRFGRDIMADVVDLENGEQRASNSSPEVQFMGASSLPRSSTQRPQPIEPEVQGSPGLGSNDEIFSRRPPNNRAEEFFALLRRARPRREHPVAREIRLRNRHLGPIFHQNLGSLLLRTPPRTPGVDLTIDLDEEDPVQMTYARSMATQTPPSNTTPGHTAPPAAPEGFTRSPDNITVCPNCDKELGAGDDPIRRQIWVAKPCGHVYCGQCTKNRAVSKGKQKGVRERPETRPFSKCVVAGCEKSVSQPKAMFQIYL